MYFSTVCFSVHCDIFVVNHSISLLVTLHFSFHDEKNSTILELYT